MSIVRKGSWLGSESDGDGFRGEDLVSGVVVDMPVKARDRNQLSLPPTDAVKELFEDCWFRPVARGERV
jgi:hypothetical protein